MFARLLAICLLILAPAFGAANIVLINADGAGVGFNDPTPAAPVGGNPGTTLGQQRIVAFVRAAQIWGANLNSSVPIVIEASWPALPCSATSGVLGAAGAYNIYAGSPGTLPNYWYASALAEKLAGINISGTDPDIITFFNRDLGKPGCLFGLSYYLGLDANPPPNGIDLVETLLHEFGHGLGFSSFTDETSGQFCCAPGGPFLPSIYDRYLLDKNTGLHWDVMSNTQRAASAINAAGQLVWDGPLVVSNVPTVLAPAIEARVTAPAAAGQAFLAGPASFGPPIASPVNGEVMPVTGGGGLGCVALSPLDALAVSGKIAVVNRGTCAFTVKAKNVQNAGAKGVIIVNTLSQFPPPPPGGVDPTVTIPTVMITPRDGGILQNLLRFRSRANSGVFARLGQSPTVRAGADSANRAYIYAPDPVQPGSSISHWDVSTSPDQLMEPNDTPVTSHEVKPARDLTLPALQQMGW